MSTPPPDTPQSIAQDFVYVVNTVYGTYLDASMAIGDLSLGYIQIHKDHIEKVKTSGEPLTPQLLNPVLFYSVGPEGKQRAVHQTTLQDMIERNSIHGRHIQFLARMCVVSLYQYWEDGFRPRLSTALGRPVVHDVFGSFATYGDRLFTGVPGHCPSVLHSGFCLGSSPIQRSS